MTKPKKGPKIDICDARYDELRAAWFSMIKELEPYAKTLYLGTTTLSGAEFITMIGWNDVQRSVHFESLRQGIFTHVPSMHTEKALRAAERVENVLLDLAEQTPEQTIAGDTATRHGNKGATDKAKDGRQ